MLEERSTTPLGSVLPVSWLPLSVPSWLKVDISLRGQTLLPDLTFLPHDGLEHEHVHTRLVLAITPFSPLPSVHRQEQRFAYFPVLRLLLDTSLPFLASPR